MDPINNPQKPLEAKGGSPDPETLKRVKELFLLFAHAISATKLFPAHHASVINFQEELYDKLTKFLEEHEELNIGIQENAFTYEGEIAYRDENILKSLPYLFFKDGMHKLTFLRDLDKAELLAFLDVVRTVSLLPPDQHDIVESLWEKDFPHSRYYVPDEFLESRLAIHQKKALDLKIDKAQMSQGKIELTAEDREVIHQKLTARLQKEQKEAADFASLTDSLDKGDSSLIESMLSYERDISTALDFLGLIFELLYTEDRLEPFKKALSFVEKRYQEWLKKGDFTYVAISIRQMEDLAQILSLNAPERALEVEKFLKTIIDQCPLEALLEMARQGQIKDFKSFFEFLRRLGSKTLSIGAELLEDGLDPEVRSAAFEFLEEMGKDHLDLLANLAQEQKPFITKAIIAIFSHLQDQKAIPFLAKFLSYKNKDIKIEVIEALGRFSDTVAHKILLEFMREDKDEDIRTAAAEKIHLSLDKDLMNAAVHLALAKNFHAKSLREKESLLKALERGGSDEACDFLRVLLKKSGFLKKAKIEESRLCAIRSLEAIATPKAVEVLRGGAGRAKKKIKSACREALERLTTGTDAGRERPS